MITQIVQKFKARIVRATLLSGLSAAASIVILAVTSQSVNVASLVQLQALIPTFLGAIVLMMVIGFASQWLLSRLGISLVYELRMVLLRRVLNADYENLTRIGGHRVYATVTADVESIAQAFGILPMFAVNLATIVLCSIYLGSLSLTLYILLFLGLGGGVVLSMFIMNRGRKHFTQLREATDGLFGSFKAMVDGSKELSINHNRRRFFFENQAMPSASQVRDIEYKAQYYGILSLNLSKPMLFLTMGVVMYAGFSFLAVNSLILTNFILFTTYLVGPLSFVMNTYQPLMRSKIAYQKIQSLQLTDDDSQVSSLAPMLSDWQSIELKNISYSYPADRGDKFCVGPINMKIKQGEILFIRGGNGSGKSTFAKILVGLYQAQQGSLSFANQIINQDNYQWYRRHFSTVFSDFYLFEHILNSEGELVVKADLQAHLEQLQLTDKVDVVDGKFSTTDLSQGQRKRLAMLLSYAEDAQIYLFDEWAADQDPVFRHYFYTQLLPELKAKGKTVVAITHDEQYFYCADRICQFDAGHVKFEAVPAQQKLAV
jgi:cyclic peptide transporter